MKHLLLISILLITAGSLVAQTPTVADLTTTSGSNIKWYGASTGGSALATSTALTNGTIYYASQTVNGVESTSRLAVTATVNPLPTPSFTDQPGATANTNTVVTYTTQSGKSSYVWTFPGTVTTDYIITSGGTSTDYTVTLKYVTTGSKTVTVNYTANGCSAASATSSTATTVSVALAIGDSYGGGKVAYILQPTDPGYIAGETHGLIAAPSDQSTGSDAVWGCDGTAISGADGTAIGTGKQNTIDIIAGCATAGIAARLCGDLVLDGYDDWYLPSKDELNKLYLNKTAIGGFAADTYWSSSEADANNTWYQFFPTGYQVGNSKVGAHYVRAVRSF